MSPAWWDKVGEGTKVENTVEYDPEGATVDLFTIAGGRILLMALLGQVTVQIARNAAGDANSKLRLTTTTGAAGTNDLCGNLDTDTLDVDCEFSITGTVGNPMVSDARVGVIVPSLAVNLLVLQPGTILLAYTANAGGVTGTIRWTIHYHPIDEAVRVVAA